MEKTTHPARMTAPVGPMPMSICKQPSMQPSRGTYKPASWPSGGSADQELGAGETPDITPETETGWRDDLYYLAFEARDSTPIQAGLRLSNDGSSLSFFKQAPDIAEGCPARLDMGIFSIRLQVPAAGAVTLMRLYFSPSLLEEGFRVYKYDTVNGWFDYTGYVEPGGDLSFMTLELQDGGYGDADGVANGIIVDPLGAGSSVSPAGGGRSSGGGCFIGTLAPAQGVPGGYALGLLLSVVGIMVFRAPAMRCYQKR